MSSLKKQLNNHGFGHIELLLIAVVLLGVSSIGYYVYNHSRNGRVNTYTELTTIVADGVNFSEKACIASQSGTAPNYYDSVDAVISVNRPVGQNDQPGGGYNPVAFYSINSSAPIEENGWDSSSISTLNFTMPVGLQSDSFNLGIESSSKSGVFFPGSIQTFGSLSLCSSNPTTPALQPKLQTLVPFIKTSSSGSTTTTTAVVSNPAANKTTTTTTTTNLTTKKQLLPRQLIPVPKPLQDFQPHRLYLF